MSFQLMKGRTDTAANRMSWTAMDHGRPEDPPQDVPEVPLGQRRRRQVDRVADQAPGQEGQGQGDEFHLQEPRGDEQLRRGQGEMAKNARVAIRLALFFSRASLAAARFSRRFSLR